MRRLTLTSALVAGLAVAAVGPAGASAATAQRAASGSDARAFAQITGQPQGRVTVAVRVTRFTATAAGPRARGVATATLRGLGGLPTTVRRKVTLAVARKGSCNILTLRLEQLDLTLLGLNVHLDKVLLKVTGHRRGGVLGSLFCQLAGAKVKASRAAAARLDMRLRRSPMRALTVTVPVRAVAAQTPVCKVLELTLGPLDVDLLGLVVALNRVHLTITATPNGGVLGKLFCGLADGSTA